MVADKFSEYWMYTQMQDFSPLLVFCLQLLKAVLAIRSESSRFFFFFSVEPRKKKEVLDSLLCCWMEFSFYCMSWIFFDKESNHSVEQGKLRGKPEHWGQKDLGDITWVHVWQWKTIVINNDHFMVASNAFFHMLPKQGHFLFHSYFASFAFLKGICEGSIIA